MPPVSALFGSSWYDSHYSNEHTSKVKFPINLEVLPLAPPTGCSKELNTMVTKLIWNNKRPRVCLKSTHRPKSHGGLSLPDFWSHYLAFQMRSLRTWINADSVVSWRAIEATITHRLCLQDLPFYGNI